MIIDVVIPAYNEEKSLPLVLAEIPRHLIREVIVVDNNSKDQTAEVASQNNSKVILATQQGYGSACLKAIEYISQKEVSPDVVVFLDADYSDYPQDMEKIVCEIEQKNADLVVGVRVKELRENGAMMPQQIFGNKLASLLIRWIYKKKIGDLGPFRAIRWKALQKIEMKDTTYGWTVEMQIKIIRNKLNYAEVPVRYKKRIGVSKISGTLSGSVKAGYKIIATIFKYS